MAAAPARGSLSVSFSFESRFFILLFYQSVYYYSRDSPVLYRALMFVGLFDDCVCNDNALPKRGGLIIGGSEEGGEVLSRVGDGRGGV